MADEKARIIYDFAGARRLLIQRYGPPGRYRVSLFVRQEWLFVFHSWTRLTSTVFNAGDDSEALDRALEWASGITEAGEKAD